MYSTSLQDVVQRNSPTRQLPRQRKSWYQKEICAKAGYVSVVLDKTLFALAVEICGFEPSSPLRPSPPSPRTPLLVRNFYPRPPLVALDGVRCAKAIGEDTRFAMAYYQRGGAGTDNGAPPGSAAAAAIRSTPKASSFTCSLCGECFRVDYHGTKPPFCPQLVFMEDVYCMKDPFSVGGGGEAGESVSLGHIIFHCAPCLCSWYVV